MKSKYISLFIKIMVYKILACISYFIKCLHFLFSKLYTILTCQGVFRLILKVLFFSCAFPRDSVVYVLISSKWYKCIILSGSICTVSWSLLYTNKIIDISLDCFKCIRFSFKNSKLKNWYFDLSQLLIMNLISFGRRSYFKEDIVQYEFAKLDITLNNKICDVK